MLYFISDSAISIGITYFGALICFIATALLLHFLKEKLPTDIGRAYAVNAAAAKGKPRGAGIIMIISFTACALLFVPFSLEHSIYLALMIFAMLSGYLDDASRIPWGDYKKGLLDLIIALLITVTFVLTNSTDIRLVYTGLTVTLPVWLYILLGTILVWVSINVVNCTDGVDGLCSSLSLESLAAFIVLFNLLKDSGFSATTDNSASFVPMIILFMAAIAAYLLFNAGPSIMLMGDAGSRTIGVFFALTAMKSGAPLMFLLLCLVFTVDGGIGLIKVALLRFLKVRILVNTRTPLHDQTRKNMGWSDTQTVIRFIIINLVICFTAIYLI